VIGRRAFENQLLSLPATSWPDAAAKARYVLNLYAAGSRLRTAVIAISSQQYWKTLRASPAAIERNALHLRPSKLFAGSPLEEAGQVTLTRRSYDLVAPNFRDDLLAQAWADRRDTSCAERSRKASMIIADEILDLLKRKRRLKLTATAIAEILYWEDRTYQQRVKASCLTLHEQGRLVRNGQGSLDDPYVYSIAAIERQRS
jgi:hypothetical protein